MPTAAEIELAVLLEAYQLRDLAHSERFFTVTRPLLRRWARRNGYGLPSDALEEVVQEVFTSILKPELARFDSSRGTAKKYLLGPLLNAVKTVQVAYGLKRTGSDFEGSGQRVYLQMEEFGQSATNVISFEAIHARHLVDKLFANADSALKIVCLRVWADEEPRSTVATDLGISRFALARKLAAFKTRSARFAACA